MAGLTPLLNLKNCSEPKLEDKMELESLFSETVISCKEHGSLRLTLKEESVFFGQTPLNGLCPHCQRIPRQIIKLSIKEKKENRYG